MQKTCDSVMAPESFHVPRLKLAMEPISIMFAAFTGCINIKPVIAVVRIKRHLSRAARREEIELIRLFTKLGNLFLSGPRDLDVASVRIAGYSGARTSCKVPV